MDEKRISESLKKAQDKYRKVSTRTYSIRLNKQTDADVIEVLDRIDNKQAYIRNLVRSDIEANSGDIKETASRYNKDRIINICFNKKTEEWHATCPAAGLNIRSDSYDVILNKISRAMGGEYVIKTSDIEVQDDTGKQT